MLFRSSWRDDNLDLVVRIGIVRIPIGDLRAVGRKKPEALEFFVRGDAPRRTRLHIDNLQRGLVGVAELRMILVA